MGRGRGHLYGNDDAHENETVTYDQDIDDWAFRLTQQVLMLQVVSLSFNPLYLHLLELLCQVLLVKIAPYIRYSSVCTAYIRTRDLYLGSGKGRPSDNGH